MLFSLFEAWVDCSIYIFTTSWSNVCHLLVIRHIFHSYSVIIIKEVESIDILPMNLIFVKQRMFFLVTETPLKTFGIPLEPPSSSPTAYEIS